MPSRRKYRIGEVITSLDELAKQEFIYFHEKIYHCGWWKSWSFQFVKRRLDDGCIYKAERRAEDGN